MENREPKLFVATKAFIEHQGKVLIIRESGNYKDGTNIGKYDVPGGKVRPGENFLEGLKREVQEETGLDVSIGEPFFIDEWRPIVHGEQLQIVGIFFRCRGNTGDVVLGSDFDDFAWIYPADAGKYNLMRNYDIAFEKYARK